MNTNQFLLLDARDELQAIGLRYCTTYPPAFGQSYGRLGWSFFTVRWRVK